MKTLVTSKRLRRKLLRYYAWKVSFVTLTLNNPTLICILSILLLVHFLCYWQGEFVWQSRNFFIVRSFSLFSWPYCFIQQWCSKVKLDPSHSKGVKMLTSLSTNQHLILKACNNQNNSPLHWIFRWWLPLLWKKCQVFRNNFFHFFQCLVKGNKKCFVCLIASLLVWKLP